MKRSIQSSETTIKEFNSKIKRQSETVDANILGKNSFKETKKINLSAILNKIKDKIKIECNFEGLNVFKIQRPNKSFYQVIRNKIDIEKLYNTEFFLENFKQAFGYDFENAEHKIKLFPHITLLINVDIINSKKSNISVRELNDFRFLTCMLFGLIFNITLFHCDCHPTTFQDFVLLDAGVGKNCISSACKQLLEFFPHFYDPLLHFDCSNTHYQNLIFTFLNLASTGDINVNITTKQVSNKN